MKKKWYESNWKEFFYRLTWIVYIVATVFSIIAGFIAQTYGEALMYFRDMDGFEARIWDLAYCDVDISRSLRKRRGQ